MWGSSDFQPEWWKACQARVTAASSCSGVVVAMRAISCPLAGLVLMISAACVEAMRGFLG